MIEFGNLKVSTSTYMVYYSDDTILDLDFLFRNLITVVREGKVKKITEVGKEGTIMNMKYGREQRGIILEKETYFPNQITLTMSLSDKNINCFLFKNKIEIRGVKKEENIVDTINFLHENFKKINQKIPKLIGMDSIMINLNYKFPFRIDRLILKNFLVENGYRSYYDPQFDNGTNIKIKNKDEKDQTIIIFQSGIVMHSGKNINEMKEAYEKLYPLISENKDLLEKKFRID